MQASTALRKIAHVGLHKTGTSALQRFFATTESDYFVACRCGYMDIFDAAVSGKQLLLSDENLSGNPFRKDGLTTFQRFRSSIESVHKLFEPAGYILGLREHTKFVESCYRQYLAEGGVLQFEDFFQHDDPSRTIDLSANAWRERIEFLNELVGPDNVFVYLQEDLSKQFDRVRVGLESFLGTEFKGASQLAGRNIGVGVRSAKVLQTCNRVDVVLRKYHLPVMRGRITNTLGISSPQVCRKWLRWIPQSRNFFSAEQATFLKEHYAADWQFAQNTVATSFS
ncbi:hypothetical protein SAMN06265222_102337 [Neorhodopirellula lusitana]|uniref:Sulfotransferase domain-containing protein n=1 Tax=Neorhodopirellula lusitana TaxID=445327 RepID=A0ABY1PTW9_9BACT|nr:hypothetical protein [Neorhodopirellula lusitana]SMP47781.1 hypothetical protein SAMN06265222_102337 [Neorhodopirellula lusitana]